MASHLDQHAACVTPRGEVSPLRVLLADDDPVARAMLRTTIAPLGYDMVEAADGEQAWGAFEATPAAVVITDWTMPGLDGLELTRRIRAAPTPSYTYVILVTGVRGRGEYLAVVDAGADDLLLKPFDRRELLARLRVASRIVALQGRLLRLERLLPICAYCHRIRDDQGEWHPIERYLEGRTGAQVSHGICGVCYSTISRVQFGEE